MKLKRLIIVTATAGGFLGIALTYQACGRFSTSGFEGEYSAGSTSTSAPTSTEALDRKSQALNVLVKNCASCHDSNNYGGTALTYVDDLNKLAVSNYVVPGNPLSSKLYIEMANGSMPPGSPVSFANLGLVYDWIKDLGVVAPSPTPIAPPVATPKPTPTPVATSTPVATPVPTPTPSMATFSYINANILQQRCASCHGNAGGYSYANYSATLKSVVTKNAAASPLYTSVKSGNMPKGGSVLTPQQIQLIFDWIQAGALNN